jgi:hypothetical protein
MPSDGVPLFVRLQMLRGLQRTICTRCHKRLLDSTDERKLADAENRHRCDPTALALAAAIRKSRNQKSAL